MPLAGFTYFYNLTSLPSIIAAQAITRHVDTDAASCSIPGLELQSGFVTSQEEQAGPSLLGCSRRDLDAHYCAFTLDWLHALLTQWMDKMLSWLCNNQSPLSYAQDLLQEVRPGPWETLARRRVQHFGYKFEYVVRSEAALVPALYIS